MDSNPHPFKSLISNTFLILTSNPQSGLIETEIWLSGSFQARICSLGSFYLFLEDFLTSEIPGQTGNRRACQMRDSVARTVARRP